MVHRITILSVCSNAPQQCQRGFNAPRVAGPHARFLGRQVHLNYEIY